MKRRTKKERKMNSEFGRFIETKRKEREITLRGFAEMINISPAFMSDLEKGRRYPPDLEKLILMAKYLKLNTEETQMMFDLAGKVKEKNSVSPDLPEYIMDEQNTNVRLALRLARDTNADNEVWQEVINILEKRKQKGEN